MFRPVAIAVMVGFAQTVYSVMEDDEFGNGRTFAVSLTLDGEIDRTVTVLLTTSSGSAIGETVALLIDLLFM